MTEMSMNKAIHGAFRRDLERFIAALRTFSAGDQTRARQLGTAWANFDDQLTYHHEGEHAIAWPALESVGVSKELLATMDAEHDAMATALAETRTAIDALTRTAGADESAAALAAVETLKAVTVAHLDHEEAEIEPVYLDKRDTPELRAMGKAFGKISPTRGGRFFAWLLDGASPEEREAVTREVPGPVVAIIGGIFGRGYRKNVAPVWKG
jgi:hemerythrin-like domain-containing protein